MSNETLIRCCVPAMAGPKTGNMIVPPCTCRIPCWENAYGRPPVCGAGGFWR